MVGWLDDLARLWGQVTWPTGLAELGYHKGPQAYLYIFLYTQIHIHNTET